MLTHHRATQQTASPHLLRHTLQGSHPDDDRGLIRDDLPKYVVFWDNVSFHLSNTIRPWFAPPYRMHMEFFPFYCPVLNKTEEFYSVWRWKVLRLPATYSDDPAGCHGCNMRGHHSRRLQRRDKTFQKILSVLHRREDIH